MFQVLATRGNRRFVVGEFKDKGYALRQGMTYKSQHPGYRISIHSTKVVVQTEYARLRA